MNKERLPGLGKGASLLDPVVLNRVLAEINRYHRAVKVGLAVIEYQTREPCKENNHTRDCVTLTTLTVTILRGAKHYLAGPWGCIELPGNSKPFSAKLASDLIDAYMRQQRSPQVSESARTNDQ